MDLKSGLRKSIMGWCWATEGSSTKRPSGLKNLDTNRLFTIDWMFMYSQNSHPETLIPILWYLKVGPLLPGHEGWVLRSNVNALIKIDMRGMKRVIYQQGGGLLPSMESTNILNLNFPASKLKNRCLLLNPHSLW